MNTDNNRRFQDTEAQIIRAYAKIANTKKLTRITVADICREAGIHRTTFYGHFQDVAALETNMVKKQFNAFYLAFFDTEGNWQYHEGTLHLVRFFGKNRDTIKKYFTEDGNGGLPEMLTDKDVILKHMDAYKKAFHCSTEQEVWYHQTYLCHGMLAVIRTWVLNGCEEPAEEIAAMLTKFCGIGQQP